MVASCHVLALLLCIGSVLEAQTLFLKAAPAVIATPAPTSSNTRKLTKEEAGFLLDALLEKMKVPENKARMVAEMANSEPEMQTSKSALPIMPSLMHDAMTKLGFRDDEILEVFADAIAMADADPILALKVKAYTTIVKGAPLSLLFHAKTMVINAAHAVIAAPAPTSIKAFPTVTVAPSPLGGETRKLTNVEAGFLLDVLLGKIKKTENKRKIMNAMRDKHPDKAATLAVAPIMHEAMTKLGLQDVEIVDVMAQVVDLADSDPGLTLKLRAYTKVLQSVLDTTWSLPGQRSSSSDELQSIATTMGEYRKTGRDRA